MCSSDDACGHTQSRPQPREHDLCRFCVSAEMSNLDADVQTLIAEVNQMSSELDILVTQTDRHKMMTSHHLIVFTHLAGNATRVGGIRCAEEMMLFIQQGRQIK